MGKPPRRPDVPQRRSDNEKRRLLDLPLDTVIAQLSASAFYVGSSKHKSNPAAFGLPPFLGERGDATLCDTHAGFTPTHMIAVPALLQRGVRAGLIGSRKLWTVADSGWIFEARLTNVVQSEYHGYPVRPSEAIAEPVWQRFSEWAEANGTATEKQAASNCRSLYGFE